MKTRLDNTASPWVNLDESGTGLTVNNFLTTKLSQVTNALRRNLTKAYTEQFDLTVSEWRLLSLLAHAQQLSFAELVIQSTSDKALVSRTMRQLEARGMVEMRPEGEMSRKRLTCLITPKGGALHAKVIPLARRSQAAVLRLLPPEQRAVLYSSLNILYQYCLQEGDDALDVAATRRQSPQRRRTVPAVTKTRRA